MSLPVTQTKVLATADDDNICLSQTPGAAGNLTINGAAASGGVATLDTQRVVLVTAVSDEHTKTLVIYGTDQNGNVIQESMVGPNATTGSTSQSFYTVTRISVSAAFTGAVTVGTSGVGSGPWQISNYNITPMIMAWACALVSGSANYTIQYTLDNITTLLPGTPALAWAVATTAPTSLSGAAASATGSISTPFFAWRLQINSGTGTIKATAIQAGIRN